MMQDAVVLKTKAEESFFAKVKAELKKLFVHAPGWEASAAATFTYVAPMVEALCALTDPGAAPAITLLLAKIQSALAAAAVVIKEAGPKPTLMTFLQAIQQDLEQLESAADVKDPASLQKITSLCQTIHGELSAVLNAVSA